MLGTPEAMKLVEGFFDLYLQCQESKRKNPYQPQVDGTMSEPPFLFEFKKCGDSYLFETKWSPPVELAELIQILCGVEVTMAYSEMGMGFVGLWENGEDIMSESHVDLQPGVDPEEFEDDEDRMNQFYKDSDVAWQRLFTDFGFDPTGMRMGG